MINNREERQILKDKVAAMPMNEVTDFLCAKRNLELCCHSCPTAYSSPYKSSASSFMELFSSRQSKGIDAPLLLYVKEDGKVHKASVDKNGQIGHSHQACSMMGTTTQTSKTWDLADAMWDRYWEEQNTAVMAD